MPALKQELGVPAADSLFLVREGKKPKLLRRPREPRRQGGRPLRGRWARAVRPDGRLPSARRSSPGWAPPSAAPRDVTSGRGPAAPRPSWSGWSSPPSWTPNPTRALTVWDGWPNSRPAFYVEPGIHGPNGRLPQNPSDAYILGETLAHVQLPVPLEGRRPGARHPALADASSTRSGRGDRCSGDSARWGAPPPRRRPPALRGFVHRPSGWPSQLTVDVRDRGRDVRRRSASTSRTRAAARRPGSSSARSAPCPAAVVLHGPRLAARAGVRDRAQRSTGRRCTWSAKFNGEALQRALRPERDARPRPLARRAARARSSPRTTRRREPRRLRARQAGCSLPSRRARCSSAIGTPSVRSGRPGQRGLELPPPRRPRRHDRGLALRDRSLLAHTQAPQRASRPVIGPEGDAKLDRSARRGHRNLRRRLARRPADSRTRASARSSRVDDDVDRRDEPRPRRRRDLPRHRQDAEGRPRRARRHQAIDPDIKVEQGRASAFLPRRRSRRSRAPTSSSPASTRSARARTINAFGRRYAIPLVDIGMTLVTRGEQLVRADGQVIVSMPGRPCLRCWFVTDARARAGSSATTQPDMTAARTRQATPKSSR